MTLEEFRQTFAEPSPPADASLPVQALWWAGKGGWERAHGCAQQHEGDPACDWVHAYLHRAEGDLSNARYWYRRAGRDEPRGTLPEEWLAITEEMLAGDAGCDF